VKIYSIEYNQFVDRPLDEVYAFFEKPENLEKLTPDSLEFKILTPSPIRMSVGRLIDYTIKILGINFHWRTMITDYEKNELFVDEQLKGPYAFWHHRHMFSSTGGGTQINDVVHYSLPFGIFGRVAHSLFVKNMLHRIFNYRQSVIDKLFASV
jgi:ligand-binding SRPBCC domain-containing protein